MDNGTNRRYRKGVPTTVVDDPNPKKDSKHFERKLAKRLARYNAFTSWAKLDFQVRPHLVRSLIRGLINKHEQDRYFALHHRINERSY